MSLKDVTGVSKSNNTQGVSEVAQIDGDDQQHYENILRSGYSILKNVFSNSDCEKAKKKLI